MSSNEGPQSQELQNQANPAEQPPLQSENSADPPIIAAASSAEPVMAATEGASSGPELLHHLHKAKALSERLLAVMAQREERLAEIKRRVSALDQGDESIQPLVEAENNMKEAHNRMKAVLADLGKELQTAGVTEVPSNSNFLADIPAPTGQGDEVAVLYKSLLLSLGEWKGAQQKAATDRAEKLAKQVQALRDQVNREQAETLRIRRRREELERLRTEKEEELNALKTTDTDGTNGNNE